MRASVALFLLFASYLCVVECAVTFGCKASDTPCNGNGLCTKDSICLCNSFYRGNSCELKSEDVKFVKTGISHGALAGMIVGWILGVFLIIIILAVLLLRADGGYTRRPKVSTKVELSQSNKQKNHLTKGEHHAVDINERKDSSPNNLSDPGASPLVSSMKPKYRGGKLPPITSNVENEGEGTQALKAEFNAFKKQPMNPTTKYSERSLQFVSDADPNSNIEQMLANNLGLGVDSASPKQSHQKPKTNQPAQYRF